jgi:hypothetical protein
MQEGHISERTKWLHSASIVYIAALSVCYIASNDRMRVNNELERMWSEVVVD